ncbi:hypothetical protein THRCLA_01751 [Thraustotheca clavata]|uniref:FYVE-type domain-containing protein n=1 Tax=Thraustotheca clavata TaxID=74557 RepID=A0A1W0A7C1_9STRA|nr:hypothetical protein THRCLA_01751 [Thraustotheca clavata]
MTSVSRNSSFIPQQAAYYWTNRPSLLLKSRKPIPGPWGLGSTSSVLEMSDAQLCRRGRKLCKFMQYSINQQNDALQLKRLQYGSKSKVNISADSKKHIQLIHSVELVHASLEEVMELLWTATELDQYENNDWLWQSVFEGTTGFKKERVRDLFLPTDNLPRLHSSTSILDSKIPLLGQSAVDIEASSSTSSTISFTPTNEEAGDVNEPRSQTLAAGIYKLRFEGSKTQLFSKQSEERELLYLDQLEKLSDTSFIWTIKTIDEPEAFLSQDEPPAKRYKFVLMSCHLEAIGDRVRLSFLGGYHFKNGVQDPCKRFLVRVCEAWSQLQSFVVRSRIASYLFDPFKHTISDSLHVGNGCRVCTNPFSAFIPAYACRLCNNEVCGTCSNVQAIPIDEQEIQMRVCYSCNNAVKLREPIVHDKQVHTPRRRTSSSLTPVPRHKRGLAISNCDALVHDIAVKILFHIISSLLRTSTKCQHISLHIYGNDKLHAIASVGNTIPYSFLALAIEGAKDGCILFDIFNDPRATVPFPSNMRFYNGFPLILNDGSCMGLLSIGDPLPKTPQEYRESNLDQLVLEYIDILVRFTQAWATRKHR